MIERSNAPELRVEVQDHEEILRRCEDARHLGRPVKLHAERMASLGDGLLVIVPVLARIIQQAVVEFLRGHFDEDTLDLLILARELRHGRVARVLVDGRLLADILVELREFIEPDEVEGIDVHPADGVRRVVAVGVQVIVVDDHAARRRAVGISVAVLRAIHLPIGIRQELGDGLRDGIGPAESTDDALLLARVAEALDGTGMSLRLCLTDWPG